MPWVSIIGPSHPYHSQWAIVTGQRQGTRSGYEAAEVGSKWIVGVAGKSAFVLNGSLVAEGVERKDRFTLVPFCCGVCLRLQGKFLVTERVFGMSF